MKKVFGIFLTLLMTGCLSESNLKQKSPDGDSPRSQSKNLDLESTCSDTTEDINQVQFSFAPNFSIDWRPSVSTGLKQVLTESASSSSLKFQKQIIVEVDRDSEGVSVSPNEACNSIAAIHFPYFETDEKFSEYLEGIRGILTEDRHSDSAIDIDLEASDAAWDFGVDISNRDQLGLLHSLLTILWPVKSGIVNSNFGYRVHPVTGQRKLHKGVDLKAPQGEIIHNGMEGTVTATGTMGSCGLGVILKHSNGYHTVYCHLSQILAAVGQAMTTQSHIGRVGKTGMATGPHLHLGLKENGVFINPRPYLAKR